MALKTAVPTIFQAHEGQLVSVLGKGPDAFSFYLNHALRCGPWVTEVAVAPDVLGALPCYMFLQNEEVVLASEVA